MKLSKYLMLLALAVATMSVSALAQVPVDQIRLGNPTYQGTGCPLGTVSAQLSSDARSLSILFGAFEVQAGGSSGKTVDRKACSIAIPMIIPSGVSVSVIKVDYRGYNRLPMNASSTFDVEYFMSSSGSGPAYHKSFVGATDGNFTLNNTLIASAVSWTPCGEEVNLRTMTSIAAQTNQMNEQAMMTLDSADISSGVVYQLQWRQCGGGNGDGGNGGGYPNPYPTPYPYPTPNSDPYGLGPCVINSYQDQRGFQVYMVKDGTGRILGNTVQYAQAISIAQSAQSSGFCVGIVNNAPAPGNPNDYPPPPPPNPYPHPNPNPYPNPYPNPAPRQSGCQIMPGGNAYGQRFYRVIDRQGRILFNTPDYNVAQSFVQTNAACY